MDEHESQKSNDTMSELKALVNHFITEEELKYKITELRRNTKQLVQEKPIPVLIGAVAFGFILGKILKR